MGLSVDRNNCVLPMYADVYSEAYDIAYAKSNDKLMEKFIGFKCRRLKTSYMAWIFIKGIVQKKATGSQ